MPSVQAGAIDLRHGTRTQLLRKLQTSELGLTMAEAERRLKQVGPNEPPAAQRAQGIRQLVQFFANPLVIILLVASVVSAALGETLNATIIVIMVLLSVALNFFQAARSQRAADHLRASVTPTATVLRDGAWQELPRRELVPGDIIRLSAGDLVPADARLIEAHDLHVQQAALTGESLPSEKEASDSEAQDGRNGGDSDTRVTATQPLAETRHVVLLGSSVVSGAATAVVVATGAATAFGDIVARLAARPPETEFDRGLRRFSFLIMRTVIFLVLFALAVNLAFKRPAFDSFLFAAALAVGLTPEFLPMITTVTLGQGALRMAREKVIVKHLAALQNFGSMDILCSDKTGTLTTGELVLGQHLDSMGQNSGRVLLLAAVNSEFETGIRSPLDTAILAHGRTDVSAYHKIDEIPFDFERRRSSVVAEVGGQRLLVAKGAPESIMQISASYERAGTTIVAEPLEGEARRACEATYQRLSEQGYRVLALGYRAVPAKDAYHADEETGLTLAGFLAFVDPPLPEARAVLAAFHRDGLDVKILTGDNDLMARHLCEQVGLNGRQIVLGDQLDTMSDSALQHVAEQTQVFARVSPAQKNRIMLALKARGHVVGFLGDGINDAPSLHVADVGISVASAVDIAKDAAEIILLEHSLTVLHRGILEGRKAFGNVMKYLLMGTSSNFGNMFSMAGAALFLPFLPMLPTQILLNNFLYDLSQVTIPTDNVDESFIVKPHRWDISLIRDFMVFIGPISSLYDFLTFFVLLAVFHATEPLFQTGWFVESLATQTLVIFVIRTAGNPFRSRPSRALTLTTLTVVLVGMLLPVTPLAGALGFVPLPPLYFLFLLVATITYLALVQVVKGVLMRRRSY
ncbi:MAG TPA: magnesium-translocating P-type ATPase [Ktedonobacterales bacterium]